MVSASPTRIPRAGFMRFPWICTLPPWAASAASDRDLKKRAAQSHLSTRTLARFSLAMAVLLLTPNPYHESSANERNRVEAHAGAIRTAPATEIVASASDSLLIGQSNIRSSLGQIHGRVNFLSRGSGYTLFLKAAGECAREVAPSGAAALPPGSRAAWAATFPVHRGDRPLIKPYSPGQAAADSLAGNPLSTTIEAPNVTAQ